MADVMSASAKKRAAKKARDAAHAVEEPAAAPAPAPKAAEPKSKAKAPAQAPAEPKAKAKGKAKAAEPAPAPKAEPKAQGKAKGAAKAAEPAAGKAKAKAEGKAKAKAKAKEVQETPQFDELGGAIEYDDGQGGEWTVASDVSDKKKKQQERKEAKKAEEEAKAIEEAKAKAAAEKEKKKAEAAAAKAKANAKAEIQALTSVVSTKAVPVVKKQEPEKKESDEPDPNVSVSVTVPDKMIGRIIGPKGTTIATIKEKTEVKAIDTQGSVVTIVGLPEQVKKAEQAVKELVERGNMSLSYEEYSQGEVTVNSNSLPNIIGQRGVNIQKIKADLKVEIDVEKKDEKQDPKKNVKVKVSISGEKVNVVKAKEVIEGIDKNSYHELTHPGYSHTEMAVEDHKYRFLIGKGGSEMRHIQNSFKVRVNIPREGSGTDKVVVIGEKNDVDRAVKYMEKVLLEADRPREREAPEKQDHFDKDEAPVEDWMKGYMKQR